MHKTPHPPPLLSKSNIVIVFLFFFKEQENMNGFDRLPDCLISNILNFVSDVESLARCRAVSKRLNSLVPLSHSLILRVDFVISLDSDSVPDFHSLRTVFSSPQSFLPSNDPRPISSAAAALTRILCGFNQIRHLEIESPPADLRLEKGVFVTYRAVFGAGLESCAIFGFRYAWEGAVGREACRREEDNSQGLVEGMVWSLRALMAASVRHRCVATVVAREHRELARLVMRDRDGQGEVSMDERGLRELKAAMETGSGSGSGSDDGSIPVATAKMRMWHEGMLKIQGDVSLEGAILVILRPNGEDEAEREGRDEAVEDAELALKAFGSGVYGEAVTALLRNRSDTSYVNVMHID